MALGRLIGGHPAGQLVCEGQILKLAKKAFSPPRQKMLKISFAYSSSGQMHGLSQYISGGF